MSKFLASFLAGLIFVTPITGASAAQAAPPAAIFDGIPPAIGATISLTSCSIFAISPSFARTTQSRTLAPDFSHLVKPTPIPISQMRAIVRKVPRVEGRGIPGLGPRMVVRPLSPQESRRLFMAAAPIPTPAARRAPLGRPPEVGINSWRGSVVVSPRALPPNTSRFVLARRPFPRTVNGIRRSGSALIHPMFSGGPFSYAADTTAGPTTLFYTSGGESGAVSQMMVSAPTGALTNETLSYSGSLGSASWGWVSSSNSPHTTNWPAQNYAVTLQITAPNTNLQISEVKVYRVDSNGVPTHRVLR
ncbi:MAG: hypothetical protein ABI182_01765 [Candidatus Baltobacteraceae bacterium]